jgi:Co/Zn/Cd efflux system component
VNNHSHAHVSARTVLTAAALTLAAAGAEVLGSWRSGSLFLTADAVHLVAHLGIFGILLMPVTRAHEYREDLAAVGVWLVAWAGRLLFQRVRFGPGVWTLEKD